MSRFALKLMLVTVFSWIGIASAQNMMPLPTHTNVYSGQARGFWFVAPMTFEITGLRVASQAGSGTQAIQVVEIHDPMPIAFTSQSSNFTTLYYTNTGANGQILPVSILINAGDTIGILGTAGTANSYGSGSYNSSIFSNTVPIQRFGYQGNINTGATSLIWGVGYQSSGSVSRVEVYYDLATISSFPYCEDFEGTDGNWKSSGILPSWEWGEPDNTNIASAYSGDNAWVTDLDGSYNNDELSYLTSPLMDFTALQDPVLRFWSIRDLESGDDGVQVQVSADSGSTYSVLGSSASSNWYNSSTVAALTSIGNGNGWTGSDANWTSVQHSLSTFSADTNVLIRLVMAADGNTVGEGFGVDHVIVGESNDISLVELMHPDSQCGGSNTTVSAAICNISVVEKTGFSIDLDTNGTTVTTTYNDTLPVCGCDTVELLNINSSSGGYWTLEAEIVNSGDVNSSNDTLSGDMLMYATPGVHLVGGGSNCEGEVDTLTFTFDGVAPWNLSYTNGTSPSYIANITSNPFQVIVSQSGNYAPIYITDSTACPADTSGITGEAIINFFPAPVVELGNDSSVCEGFVLDAGAGYSNYQWSTGHTTQQVVATQTNIFSVTVTDSIGCTGSDVVDLEVFPGPVIGINDTVLCEGATFLFNAGGGAASYVWHDGSTGQVFQIDSVGTVSVTVTSFFGCADSAEASITAVVPNPTPNISSTSSYAPVTLDAGAGYIAYKWNTNATTQTISVSIPGTYTCTVTDQNGCKGDGQRKAKIWPAGVEEFTEAKFEVWPNPASQFIHVRALQVTDDALELKLYDARGSMVMQRSLNATVQETVNVSSLPAGSYVLELQQGSAIQKFQLILTD